MKNLVQDGKILTLVTPTGGVVSGQAVLIGNLFAVSTGTYAEAEEGEYQVSGVFTLPKLSTDTIDQGQLVYWDNSNKRITETPNSNYKVGVSTVVAGNGTTTVNVKLDNVATVAESA